MIAGIPKRPPLQRLFEADALIPPDILTEIVAHLIAVPSVKRDRAAIGLQGFKLQRLIFQRSRFRFES
jgi:hypothetical protein